ncbi:MULTISPECIES: hypothetical protein [Pseudomonas syringae group]|uniref:hypothetical protein n=1 Tax=Pseudomonas syringae group TaxID=136849 RepID=UPI000A61328A|nr:MULTISPECIES: hypothetical protein [Pseudomonas syringae group]
MVGVISSQKFEIVEDKTNEYGIHVMLCILASTARFDAFDKKMRDFIKQGAVDKYAEWGQMMARSVLIHFFACAIYVVANYCGISLYKAFFGGLTSRGASIGIAMYMVFYLFVFLNIVIAVIPRQIFKWCIVAFMVVLILVYLLPLYPIRALAYGALTGGLTALAIVVAGKFERFWLSRALK